MPGPQRDGEEIVLDLGGVRSVSALSLARGPAVEGVPPRLVLSVSTDDRIWTDVWSGGTGGAALEGALRDAPGAASRIVFRPTRARFIRLRQLHEGAAPWIIAELAVYGTTASSSR
jgi:hypothetical protein